MKLLPSLKQLEYLSALAELQHFGKASDLCNVTPSTLSAGIRDLEAVLGVALAERTKRMVLMTPVGLEIADRARVLLRDAEDIMGYAAAYGEPMTGEMTLGVIPTIGPFLLPKVLPTLNASYPSLSLFLREEQTASLLARLRGGEIDLAVIALPFETEDLTVRVLFDDIFQFACHADHSLAGRKSITDRDFVDQPLLLLEEGHCLRGHALDACRLRNSPIRVQFEATSLNTIVQMVASGLGVTLLPQMAIDANIAAGTNIRLIPLLKKPSRRIGIAWRASSPRSPEFDLLAEGFRSHKVD
ncbi:MAG: hydrogen peroxide-inducible genes activator [Rhodospirillales bacterium]|nr:hydrogen peroxide-inducible genes activator [Rhodospirillales bacterium]